MFHGEHGPIGHRPGEADDTGCRGCDGSAGRCGEVDAAMSGGVRGGRRSEALEQADGGDQPGPASGPGDAVAEGARGSARRFGRMRQRRKGCLRWPGPGGGECCLRCGCCRLVARDPSLADGERPRQHPEHRSDRDQLPPVSRPVGWPVPACANRWRRCSPHARPFLLAPHSFGVGRRSHTPFAICAERGSAAALWTTRRTLAPATVRPGVPCLTPP